MSPGQAAPSSRRIPIADGADGPDAKSCSPLVASVKRCGEKVKTQEIAKSLTRLYGRFRSCCFATDWPKQAATFHCGAFQRFEDASAACSSHSRGRNRHRQTQDPASLERSCQYRPNGRALREWDRVYLNSVLPNR
jgi:hypothetical protein